MGCFFFSQTNANVRNVLTVDLVQRLVLSISYTHISMLMMMDVTRMRMGIKMLCALCVFVEM